jgi:predicted dehydrogenase
LNRAVRWGVLGTANIAVERTIPALAQASGAECFAIASRDLARAQAVAEQFGVPRAYGTYAELLSNPDVDCVYIPLPNQLHVEWAGQALRAGKAVLCEKPLCLTADDVRKLIRCRDETVGLIEEALVFRSHPQWGLIADQLNAGSIGVPLAVQGTIAKQFLDPQDIRNQPGLGGGATYDLGVYVIAACNAVFRRAPTRVSAVMDLDRVFKVDRLVTATLDYGDAQASFVVSSQGGTSAWATHQHFSVLGSEGWMRADFPYAQARPAGCSVTIGDSSSVANFPTSTKIFEPVNQYRLQVERFSALFRQEPAPHWPIEDALLTLRIIEALFQSARESRIIELD